MKALVYTDVQQVTYQEVADPQPRDNEAIIKIEYVGICGSDMHAFLGHDERRQPSLILGHEAAGIVVSDSGKNQRVVINPLVTCGKCKYCVVGKTNICKQRQIISILPRQGAFAEYVQMPDENLIALPDTFPLDKAALCEPLACGWNAAKKGFHQFANNLDGVRVLVIGGGAVGVGAGLALKVFGSNDVSLSDPNQKRRLLLQEKLDAKIISPDQLEGQAFDLIIDAVGFEQTRAVASEIVNPGGAIVHVGLGNNTCGLNIRRMTLQEISFLGVYTYSMEDFKETAKAMLAGKLGDLDWTDIRPLSDGANAFADIRAGTSSPKILLKP